MASIEEVQSSIQQYELQVRNLQRKIPLIKHIFGGLTINYYFVAVNAGQWSIKSVFKWCGTSITREFKMWFGRNSGFDTRNIERIKGPVNYMRCPERCRRSVRQRDGPFSGWNQQGEWRDRKQISRHYIRRIQRCGKIQSNISINSKYHVNLSNRMNFGLLLDWARFSCWEEMFSTVHICMGCT